MAEMTPQEVKIGKIAKVSFGFGGYQDACIGVSFTLSGPSWGVGDFWGDWAIERSEYCKWTQEDRIRKLGETVMRLNALLKDAKVESVDALKNIPVEATFEDRTLKSWRILTEVL